MLKKLILKNRSYRGFDSKRKITKQELTEIVDCARITSTGRNVQPLKYLLACSNDCELVKDIFTTTKWAGALKDKQLPFKGEEPVSYIVICQDKNICNNLNEFQKEIGIVSQTMLLKAVEMDLGGCMIGAFNKGKLKEILNLENNLEIMFVIALGKPVENIKLIDVDKNKSTRYYRDEENTHFVPKYKLEDIIL